ncbi:EEF1A lysine methyltransferase 4-like [Panonychus citri]|uniref:EEF1A lysine methyltransferase 4-like n=1 Tax=Panonychus citri TaxID=50023 RepID=UPI0023072555|nr:EEF1A lysine methyltransferase 4-like [Panonychus citri]XP_053214297.1 EEF1A lysine methyltransferase 4-like [Panonychus citri]
MMSTLPEANQTYGTKDYWISRFNQENVYEWLVDYQQLKAHLAENINQDDTILILGCGNSLLGEKLYNDGYRMIISMDYCENVVGNMSLHCDSCKSINWLTMDATNMTIKDNCIDVVLEKATIDTFLVGEKNLWSLSPSSIEKVDKTLSEISRLLKPDGKFISLSFNQPHFRGKLYSNDKYDWRIKSIDTIGVNFHHYLYVIQKGLSQTESADYYVYQPPAITTIKSEETIEEREENDIFAINLDN